jgi:hypothetical protein
VLPKLQYHKILSKERKCNNWKIDSYVAIIKKIAKHGKCFQNCNIIRYFQKKEIATIGKLIPMLQS